MCRLAEVLRRDDLVELLYAPRDAREGIDQQLASVIAHTDRLRPPRRGPIARRDGPHLVMSDSALLPRPHNRP